MPPILSLMWRIAVVVMVVGACTETESVTCPDGRVCPVESTCRVITYPVDQRTETVCATADQLEQCAGAPDGMPCTRPEAEGSCHDGVCLTSVCGNGLRDANERCDDGNVMRRDGCSATCDSDERCGNGIVDIDLGEQCDQLDNYVSHDGCSSDCQQEVASWRVLDDGRPAPRVGAGAAYDAKRRRFVVFGGTIQGPGGPTRANDLLEWDGLRWQRASPPLSPPARQDHAMAFDAARGEVIVFSGSTGTADTWAWNGTWRLLAPASSPSPRSGAQMVYDSRRQRLVMYGGDAGQGNELWTWDGTTWQQLVAGNPPAPSPAAPRNHVALAYDPIRDVIVMFGGIDTSFVYSDELWELSFTPTPTWRRVQAQDLADDSAPFPAPRAYAVAGFDSARGRVVLAGGQSVSGPLADSYGYDGQRWIAQGAIPQGSVPTLYDPVGADDPIRGRFVLVGADGGLHELDTVWEQPLNGIVPPGTAAPYVRTHASIARDAQRGEVVVFGGFDGTSALGDMWIYSGSWSERVFGGTDVVPPPRLGAAMAYDEARGEIVMYGGCAFGGSSFDALAGTWVWDGTTWHDRGQTQPGPLCEASMAYDAARAELVLFGGDTATTGSGPTETQATWVWNGSTWAQRTPSMVPTPRRSAAMAYDRIRQRVVLFGGTDNTAGVESPLGDTWLWDGTTWTSQGAVTRPPPRFGSGLAWDAPRGVLVLAGGVSYPAAEVFGDAWQWDGNAWSLLPDLGRRRQHSLVEAGDGAGVVVFAGFDLDKLERRGDLTLLRWDAPTTYEACTDSDGDGDGLVACADPDCWWRCSPVCPPGTSCATDAPRCGDASSNLLLEQCFSCPADSGECIARCGDFTCASSESTATCPGDCP